MRKYEKPSINVIELQLRENIAAVSTTVFKGSSEAEARTNQQELISMALSPSLTGLDRTPGLIDS